MKVSSLQSKARLQELIDEITKEFNKFLDLCPYQNQRLQIAAVYTFD